MLFKSNEIPLKMWLVHTDVGNEFYSDVDEAYNRTVDQNEIYDAKGLSKRTPMFEVKLGFEIY